jgi:Pregnancy-associated plasma protein-A
MRAPRAVRALVAVGLTIAIATSSAGALSSADARAVTPRVCGGDHRGSDSARVRYDPSEPSAREIVASAAALQSAVRRQSAGLAKAVTVNVYAHVLRSKSGGGVPERRIQRQVDVLNGAFAGKQSHAAAATPFRFRLADVDVTVNGRWSRMDEGTVAETRAKRALHRGNATDLNLYVGRNRSGSLGWGTQPTRLDSAPMLDGVVIARHTLPGGSRGRYSAGDAAVHETGHWLGLFHTFAGKCGRPGDLVADTPREARPSYTCPVRRDTCTAPGDDPVHNFMDYSYDSCMNQFTAGQVARMRHAWSALRAAARLDGTSRRFAP